MSGTHGYTARVSLAATADRVFSAVATLEGLRGWWTPHAGGSVHRGGTLRLEFAGVDEHILLRVLEARRPSLVRWACLVHTGAPEWGGSLLEFRITRRSAARCELCFEHAGVPRAHVARGWDHFLDSLLRRVEHGVGTPFDPGRRGRAA